MDDKVKRCEAEVQITKIDLNVLETAEREKIGIRARSTTERLDDVWLKWYHSCERMKERVQKAEEDLMVAQAEQSVARRQAEGPEEREQAQRQQRLGRNQPGTGSGRGGHRPFGRGRGGR